MLNKSRLPILLGYIKVGVLLLLFLTWVEPASAQTPPLSHTYYIHEDHLSSVVTVTDENGNPVKQNKYFPYGKVEASNTSINDRIERGYTGQINDKATTLSYYNARFYDPSLSRFISADSASDGLNLYAYVGGNPVNANDPTGKRGCRPGQRCRKPPRRSRGASTPSFNVPAPPISASGIYGHSTTATLPLSVGSPAKFDYFDLEDFLDVNSYNSIASNYIKGGYFIEPNIHISTKDWGTVTTTLLPERVKRAAETAFSRFPSHLRNAAVLIGFTAFDHTTSAFAIRGRGPGAIFLSEIAFNYSDVKLQQILAHEMGHRIQDLSIDYLEQRSVGKGFSGMSKLHISVQSTVEKLTANVIEPRGGGGNLRVTGKSTIPSLTYGLSDYDEFTAETIAAYMCNYCLKAQRGYAFPFAAPEFQELAHFYHYLTGVYNVALIPHVLDNRFDELRP